MHPSVVLCTADVGCGHLRAATAIAGSLRAMDRSVGAPIVDALAHAPRWFTALYRDAYLAAARHTPRLSGWFYDKTDSPYRMQRESTASALEGFALRRFSASDEISKATVVVCTHFLCARVLSRLRARSGAGFKLVVVITDQHPHAVWQSSGVDLFLAPSDHAAAELTRRGVPAHSILCTGIPIDPKFASPSPRSRIRSRYGLPQNRPVCLFSGGGLGLGGIQRAAESLLDSDARAHAVIVCGRNANLRRTILASAMGKTPRCRVLGRTTRMHDLMAGADLFVGKPGGLTTAEAAASLLPMVLLEPLPGQEVRNAEMLVKSGAALLCPDPSIAGQTAARLLNAGSSDLQRMQESAGRLAKPHSAKAAAKAILELARDEFAAAA